MHYSLTAEVNSVCFHSVSPFNYGSIKLDIMESGIILHLNFFEKANLAVMEIFLWINESALRGILKKFSRFDQIKVF